jgi:hypothetical protein
MVSLSSGLAPGHVGQGQQYRLAPTAFALASSRLHNLMSRAEILAGWFNGNRRAMHATHPNLFFCHIKEPTCGQQCCAWCWA